MKPKRIILLRHGESEGNADKTIYKTIPDHKLALSDNGIKQAHIAGQELKKLVGDESIHAYVSPYLRTKQTFEYATSPLNGDLVIDKVFEEPRLREQEWGHLRDPQDTKRIEGEREKYGSFYFRFPDGESGADVYDRVSTFLETLHRDFQKEDYADNTLIVTHGLTIRVFIMRWFHLGVDVFEGWRNPKNCEFFVMERDRYVDRSHDVKYILSTPLSNYGEEHENRK